jgi:hypothetical protein
MRRDSNPIREACVDRGALELRYRNWMYEVGRIAKKGGLGIPLGICNFNTLWIVY